MSWTWEWVAIGDRRTCGRCSKNDGQRKSLPGDFAGGRPPVHPRCRCVLALCWAAGGIVSKHEQIVERALLDAEGRTRGFVRDVLPEAKTGKDVARGIEAALISGRRGAREFGRRALVAEVKALRPGADVGRLTAEVKIVKGDIRSARRSALVLGSWWALAVAAIASKTGVDKKEARRMASQLLEDRSESVVITETADAFNDERASAATTVRGIK